MAEESFPRGGRIVRKRKSEHQTENLFSSSAPISKKQKKDKKNKSDDRRALLDADSILQVKSVDILTYQKVQDEMTILGCIHNIKEASLHIELPGLIYGDILLKNISNPYLANLNDCIQNNKVEELEKLDLKKLFKVGQFLPVKVLGKIEDGDKGSKIILSTKPDDINRELNYTVVTKGMMLWVAVIEKSDHCYHLDAGIKNCRVVLPFKAIDEGVEYAIGQPIWCSTRKCEIQREASTITVSTKKKEVMGCIIPDDFPLNRLVPGNQVEFNIGKVVKHGLSGKILNKVNAHVYETFLKTPFDSEKNYSSNMTELARVLYVEPATKFVKLSLRNLTYQEADIPIGSVQKAKVMSFTPRGLTLQINKNAKGFVTYTRIMKSLSLHPNSAIKESINKKYPLQSSHQCRILDYNYLEMEYICTLDASVVKEKVFQANDLKFGQAVQGKITKIEDRGIEIRVGNIVGFIPNLHISNAQFSENIKKKYKVGQIIKAKYFEKFKDSNRFTLKQTLLETESCLSNYNEATKNKQFPGLVAKITNNGVLIVFYNNVKGWLPKSRIGDEQTYSPNMFYEGQVVITTLYKIEGTKITLTLEPPQLSKRKRLQIGERVKGTVVGVEDNQLLLKVGKQKVNAILPAAHMTFDEELGKALIQTYSYNDELDNLFVTMNGMQNIVSARDSIAFDHYQLRVPITGRLKQGQLLWCSFINKSFSGIEVHTPIKGYSGLLRIFKERVTEKGVGDFENIEMYPQQGILAKVLKTDEDIRDTVLTTELKEVFDFDYKHSIYLMEEYLNKLSVLKEYLAKQKHPILNYKMGEKVKCVINKVSENGCSVTLKNGAEGLIAANHMLDQLNSGETYTGVVLYIDYMNKYLEISLLPDIVSKIKKEIKIEENSVQPSLLLLVRQKYAVALIKKSGNLCVLPTVMHENNLFPEYTRLIRKIGKTKKIFVSKLHQGVIMGIDNKIKEQFDQKHLKKLSKNNKDYKNAAKIEEKSKTHEDKNKSDTDEGIEVIETKISEEVSNISKKEDKNKKTMEDQSDSEGLGDEDLEEDESEDVDLQIEKHSDDKKQEDKDEHLEDEQNSELSDEDLEEDKSEDEDLEEDKSEDEDLNEVESEIEDLELVKDSDDENLDDKENSDDEDLEDEEDNDNDSSMDSSHESTQLTSDDDSKSEDTKNKTKESLKRSTLNSDESKTSKKKVKKSEEQQKEQTTGLLFPGVSNFFSASTKIEKDEDSSGDESDNEVQQKKTKAKSAELIKIEEEQTLQREQQIADDSGIIPQTPKEFDAALVAQPNSSRLWVLYITTLAAAGEVEKARAKAKKALETIAIEKVNEKFNVWMALLNLENMLGDQDSFDKVFDDAINYNDPLKIYLGTIQTLASSGKYVEMEEKIKKMKAKFKQNPDMYLKLAKVYYDCKKFKEARQLQGVAIKYVPDKQRHLNLLVQFAVIEFKFGEQEHGEALFETILQTDPSRVDVWSTYVDQLTKANKTALARKVLFRAVSNKLHMKKLKILLKKFYNFEKQFGDAKTMEEFKELASKFATETS